MVIQGAYHASNGRNEYPLAMGEVYGLSSSDGRVIFIVTCRDYSQ